MAVTTPSACQVQGSVTGALGRMMHHGLIWLALGIPRKHREINTSNCTKYSLRFRLFGAWRNAHTHCILTMETSAGKGVGGDLPHRNWDVQAQGPKPRQPTCHAPRQLRQRQQPRVLLQKAGRRRVRRNCKTSPAFQGVSGSQDFKLKRLKPHLLRSLKA